MGGKGLAQVLPKSSAVLDLRKSCEEILAADRPLAASVAELQEAVGEIGHPARSESRADLMKIAGGPVSTKPIRRGGARTAPGLGGVPRAPPLRRRPCSAPLRFSTVSRIGKRRREGPSMVWC